MVIESYFLNSFNFFPQLTILLSIKIPKFLVSDVFQRGLNVVLQIEFQRGKVRKCLFRTILLMESRGEAE